jgi:DNA gyrase inhibitor GyrI
MPESPLAMVERDAIDVMYLEVPDTLSEIHAAWPRFEALIGDMRGRHFLATVHSEPSVYRTCVQLAATDRPDDLGLLVTQVPGGTYLRGRLRGEPPELYERIAPMAARLEAAAAWDRDRPLIESYRRHDQVDILLPTGVDVE